MKIFCILQIHSEFFMVNKQIQFETYMKMLKNNDALNISCANFLCSVFEYGEYSIHHYS